MLEILTLVLGPVSTNTYLIADRDSREAAVIDPAWSGKTILAEAQRRGWTIQQLWYTHAHFDHYGGAAALAEGLDPAPAIALHPADQALWAGGGEGASFGIKIDRGPEPTIDLDKTKKLALGSLLFEVRPTPGHTPGHCLFFCAAAGAAFCGDLIFRRGVGRTDLEGGDFLALEESIREQVYSLPDDTRILSGHGAETSVGEEKRANPFVAGLFP